MSINLKLNDKPITVDLNLLPPDVTLNTYIRENCGLTGTKFMCQEGGCGVCMCVVRAPHPNTGEQRVWAVNSCLTLLSTCNGYDITTIEGLGSFVRGYHPLQKRLASMFGSQCGYCSPGMIMNMYALLEAKDNKVTMAEVENSFGGNICRCTGYRPILDTMKSFAVDSNIALPEYVQDIEDLSVLTCPKTGQTCSKSCQPMASPQQTLVHSDGTQWHWIKNLTDLYPTLETVKREKYMLVGGNTAHGVYRRPADLKHFVDINGIRELNIHDLSDNGLTLGGNLCLSEVMDIFQNAAQKPGFEYCQGLWEHFDLVASIPIRNTGTLAGNFMIKHANHEFPSDIYVTFEAVGAKIVLSSEPGEEHSVTLEEFLNIDMNGKVILSFSLPSLPKERFVFDSYKIMPRAQNAHAYVNAAFLVEMNKPSMTVISARLCFGGINDKFNHATNTEQFMVGKNILNKDVITDVIETLRKEVNPAAVLGETAPEYRRLLACGLLYKFILKHSPTVKNTYRSGGERLQRDLSSGQQTYETLVERYPVNAPMPKIEADIQCSGEAKYANDLPRQPEQAWAAFVTGKKVGAEIISIDASEALKMPGVLAFYSAASIKGSNAIVHKTFDFFDDEELFCQGRLRYYDQPVGMIVAQTNALAQLATERVKVNYSQVTKPVLCLMDDVFVARAQKRILQMSKSPLEKIERPKETEASVAGKLEMGLQYHFTLEPQTSVAVPTEKGIDLYAATQWMDLTQYVVSRVTKRNVSDIKMVVRRLGGAFGSKITRANFAACAASFAAVQLDIPIRFVQSIESMMSSIGKRWACRNDYQFHVKANGKILAGQNKFYEDAGWTYNESPVSYHATLCSKNCYEFKDNYKIDGHGVETDAPSNTWCRAPGSLEGVAMMENAIEHIAFETKLDPLDVRLTNLAEDHKLREVIPRFLETSDYRQRKVDVDAFNKNNRWKKRGLGLAFMEYPIFYFGSYPATVAVYHGDGSVTVTHGGIEMGQGLNTKVAQVASYTLNISYTLIKVEASDSVNGANAMVTGGAVGSESLCCAIRKACNIINHRLRPIREKLGPKAKWADIVRQAHKQQVDLIACDTYKTGDLKPYSICGVSLSEVEVDMITGNHVLKRVDILEDTGESLNPLIDVGQIEGGFVMGLGYWLTEQLVFDRQTGRLVTNRTWNYKPPGAKDIPVDFRIELLQRSTEETGFMRSKATGEPATCLAVSSIFAIQHAIQSARADAGVKRRYVFLSAPTTPEKILLYSGTDTSMFTLQ